MLILGIETSCDETSVAVVEDNQKILCNEIFSQIDIHQETGGVVPEVAAREHVLKIIPVLDSCLKKAIKKYPSCFPRQKANKESASDLGSGDNINEIPNQVWESSMLQDIDIIAVTEGPGLSSSLLAGTVTASVLSFVLNKPIVPVNHIEGHISANFLGREELNFPTLILTVSGGHNELVLMEDYLEFKVIGETLDDAAGEAFDKVARMLGLEYPGGPEISKAAVNGDSNKFDLPRSWLDSKWQEIENYDFSFSGLKSECMRRVKEFQSTMPTQEHRDQFVADMSASFQESVCEVLVKKTLAAAKKHKVKEVHIAGGVSANKRLREMIDSHLSSSSFSGAHPENLENSKRDPRNRSEDDSVKKVDGFEVHYPQDIKLCTDNAAMIALAGYYRYKYEPEKYRAAMNVVANPNLELGV